MEIHATYFPIKTQLIVSSKNPRDQETYEKDTVRVDFVNSENISLLLDKFSKWLCYNCTLNVWNQKILKNVDYAFLIIWS